LTPMEGPGLFDSKWSTCSNLEKHLEITASTIPLSRRCILNRDTHILYFLSTYRICFATGPCKGSYFNNIPSTSSHFSYASNLTITLYHKLYVFICMPFDMIIYSFTLFTNNIACLCIFNCVVGSLNYFNKN